METASTAIDPSSVDLAGLDAVPLAAGHSGRPLWYFAVLALAAVGGAVLFGGGVAAFVRRRSRPYLLVALALGALLARTALAAGASMTVIGPTTHHLGEHVLDVVMAGLVIAAVYYAGTRGGEATP
jgi:hypothetical protein